MIKIYQAVSEFVGPTGVYLLDLFCSGIQFFFTVESLSLLYLLFIYMH